MKKFALDSINYFGWELRTEFKIALTHGGDFNFDKSSLSFHVKKEIYAKVTLNLTVNIEY